MKETGATRGGLKSLLTAAVFLVPAMVIWYFVTTEAFPPLQGFWLDVQIPRWPPRSALESNRPLLFKIWFAVPVAISVLFASHLALFRWPRVRSAVMGTLLWLANAAVLVCVLYVALAALMFLLKSKREIETDVFGSNKNMLAVASAPKVTAVRLHQPGGKIHVVNLSDYTRGESVTLTPAQAYQVKAELLNKYNYVWGYMNACAVDYGLLLVFESDTPVEIAFCFSCSHFAVFRNETQVSKERLMAMRPFIKLANELFPNDETIQEVYRRKIENPEP